MTRPQTEGNELKAMLRERFWYTHSKFRHEFDKAAAEHAPWMVGHAPARGTLARWCSGGLKDLPYPDYCQVLEAMFPGVEAREMFGPAQPRTNGRRPLPTPPPPPAPNPQPRPGERGADTPPAAGTTIHTNARMRALMSWVDQNSPLKERDIHPQQPDRYRSYSRGHGVERSR
ncbi:hypothetical protein [Nocardia sp. NPDC005366]|uniref:hypothetical protein n=1 Tax=Nocardia sp. NPDC005366 TaxID=3156878 RepID=UPI0033B2AEB8